jgi:hypothetical protein
VTDDNGANELSPKRPARIPDSVAELMAVGKEAGATSMDLARLFKVNPRTVRAAIARVGDDQLQAIRRVYGMVSWMKGQQILDGIQDELLERIESGQLRKMKDGKPLTSTAQLLTMQAIQVDKLEPLSENARMAEPKTESRAGSAIGALLASQAEMSDALRVLPEGIRRKIEIKASLSVEEEADQGLMIGEAEVLDSSS